ncbi:MAG: EthD family reductase [Bacteroidota bacterium]
MKTKSFLLLFTAFIVLTAWKNATFLEPKKVDSGKIKVMILYPNEEGKTFNMDYYSQKHMPMVAKLFGEPLKSYSIDQGIAGRTPEEPLPFVAIGCFYFDQLSDYENAFGPNAEKILGDIPNYTNIQPVVQISEIVH